MKHVASSIGNKVHGLNHLVGWFWVLFHVDHWVNQCENNAFLTQESHNRNYPSLRALQTLTIAHGTNNLSVICHASSDPSTETRYRLMTIKPLTSISAAIARPAGDLRPRSPAPRLESDLSHRLRTRQLQKSCLRDWVQTPTPVHPPRDPKGLSG